MTPVDRQLLYRAVVTGVLIATLGLAGCGRRGPLEAPPSATATQSGDQSATADSGIPKPDRPFILDPLL